MLKKFLGVVSLGQLFQVRNRLMPEITTEPNGLPVDQSGVVIPYACSLEAGRIGMDAEAYCAYMQSRMCATCGYPFHYKIVCPTCHSWRIHDLVQSFRVFFNEPPGSYHRYGVGMVGPLGGIGS